MVSLKEKYRDYFTIGAAIVTKDITGKDSGHRDILKEHFNALTCSNEMKHVSVCPDSPDDYRFDDAKAILNYAQENGMELRGHTLVWHMQNGEHIFKNATKAILLERMKRHMQMMAEHFGHYVKKWDVVNEAISDSDDAYLRPNKWREIIGDDLAFYDETEEKESEEKESEEKIEEPPAEEEKKVKKVRVKKTTKNEQ